MTTVRETRKANLLLLVRRAGSKVELARVMARHKGDSGPETFQSYISQILGKKPSRAVGEAFARDLERAVDLPEGWMDMPHSERMAEVVPLHGALSDTGIQLAKAIDSLSPTGKENVRAILDEVRKLFPDKPPRKKRKR